MARKTSFYYSFLVLPAEQRQAIVAVWDFCRAVDDAVDESPRGDSELPTGRERGRLLARRARARCSTAATPPTPQGQPSSPSSRGSICPGRRSRTSSTASPWTSIRRGIRHSPISIEYCRRVASAVGMICIRIFGCRSEQAREYALNLGVALQLTNILRDVTDDLARGRVYLPLEDLARLRLPRRRPGRRRR